MKLRTTYFLLAIFLLLQSCSSNLEKIIKSNDYERSYVVAKRYYDAKKYENTIQIMEATLPSIKGTMYYEDAYYMETYAYYYMHDYINAENLFKTFSENFPTSPRIEECTYMRAYCYWKQSLPVELDQTVTKKALSLLQEFASMNPTSQRMPEVDSLMTVCRAKLELKEFKAAELYFNIRSYKAAATCFSIINDIYPDSDNGDLYKYMEVEAWFKYAQDSYYDKQEDRYKRAVTACSDFYNRFPTSQYSTAVKAYETKINTNLNTLHNEQAKALATEQ